jgi:hypothetical protein
MIQPPVVTGYSLNESHYTNDGSKEPNGGWTLEAAPVKMAAWLELGCSVAETDED